MSSTDTSKVERVSGSSHGSASAMLEIAADLAKTMQCNCDLDNWQPEQSTGHSWVCRIHKAAISKAEGQVQAKC